ncbi:MAG: ComF family protein [Armatimonadota bacterium]|jgi:ComF family protein
MLLINLLRDIASGVLEFVYPIRCLKCERITNTFLCDECLSHVELIAPPICSKCGKPSEHRLCHACRNREFHFERVRSSGPFQGMLREAIHALKYRKLQQLSNPLIKLLIQTYPTSGLGKNFDLIVPVPIHRSRMFERGFNQSELLAQGLASHLGIPLETRVLYKAINTPHQVDLSPDLRMINVRGSFGIKNPEKTLAKRILVIDDVVTTGATLDEVARVLTHAGAASVSGYTLARSL